MFIKLDPIILSLPRSDWPVTRLCSPEDIPETEFKIRDKLVFTAAARTTFSNSGVYQKKPWSVLEDLLKYSNRGKVHV